MFSNSLIQKSQSCFSSFLRKYNYNYSTLSSSLEPQFLSSPHAAWNFQNPQFSTSNPLRSVFIETYGCQMNYNDSELVQGILAKAGGYSKAQTLDQADIILLMTCAIRENAEAKIWTRLDQLKALEKQRKRDLTVGLLGCMAERLKAELLEKRRIVDIVCGPDAYRDLPRLLQVAESGQQGINVMLSMDETYADIAPVRLDPHKRSAFISIMRGCNNMCSFCIVPFTRGRERSRPVNSIVEEARQLADNGVKEITLLGQNVNSYCDESPNNSTLSEPILSTGFSSTCKPKPGLRFIDLLEQVSSAVPQMRIRFTSPHPKDFPDNLLYLMRDRSNICKQIHLPVQSGSTSVLERMRRGYSREAYLDLVGRIREILPSVSLSTDVISGFCGETEEDHQNTVDLIQQVSYDMAYMFAYSMREKTSAHRKFTDDVPHDTKQRRLREVIDTFQLGLQKKIHSFMGNEETLLVNGPSRKNKSELSGTTDGNRTVVFMKKPIENGEGKEKDIEVGDWVKVKIVGVSGSTLRGEPLQLLNSF